MRPTKCQIKRIKGPPGTIFRKRSLPKLCAERFKTRWEKKKMSIRRRNRSAPRKRINCEAASQWGQGGKNSWGEKEPSRWLSSCHRLQRAKKNQKHLQKEKKKKKNCNRTQKKKSAGGHGVSIREIFDPPEGGGNCPLGISGERVSARGDRGASVPIRERTNRRWEKGRYVEAYVGATPDNHRKDSRGCFTPQENIQILGHKK